MNPTITIDPKYCGPPNSGNGGYVSGRLSSFVDGIAEVTLRKPPPLSQPMEVVRDAERARLMVGDLLIAEALPSEIDLNPPSPPKWGEAEEAIQRFEGFEYHAFPSCFVCGPQRAEGDGLRIFPGKVVNKNMVAAPWIPAASLADASGEVNPAVVWASLDCPGAFSTMERDVPMVLGRMTTQLIQPVIAGKPYIVVGWRISAEGRKHLTGTALYDETEQLCGLAKATWIELR